MGRERETAELNRRPLRRPRPMAERTNQISSSSAPSRIRNENHISDVRPDGYFENGRKSWEEEYRDGKRDGLSTVWFENGLLQDSRVQD
jgi:hypothetical protein